MLAFASHGPTGQDSLRSSIVRDPLLTLRLTLGHLHTLMRCLMTPESPHGNVTDPDGQQAVRNNR